MSKTAILTWNAKEARFEATFQNTVVASSPNREYVLRVINGGFSRKARKLGITQVVEQNANGEAVLASNDPSVPTEPVHTVEKEFPINERFEILTQYISMVASKQLPSALVTGEGGLGKTFTVLQTLKNAGIRDVAEMESGAVFLGKRGYSIIKGYSTPKGLYRTLYENRNQICIFDDTDSILRDPTAVNLLKAALDSYDKRMVTWNAETAFGGDDDLPKSFEFTGGVIFISNLPKHKIPQAIRSRAMCADVSMTREEAIGRMKDIVSSPEFMPDFEGEHKQEAVEYIAEQATNPMVVNLNLRTLVNTIKSRAASPKFWKRLSLYDMVNS